MFGPLFGLGVGTRGRRDPVIWLLFWTGGEATHTGLCCRILDFFVVVGLYYSAAEMLQDSGPWQVTPRLTPVGTDNDYHLQFLDFVKNFTIFTCEKFHNEKFSFCK